MTKTPPLIAVVDDEEPVRKALMRLMRSVGLSVETFASGTEFLQSLDIRLPDCVVLDLHMPQINGFNVQASLARNYAALPVIIVTGQDLPNARERAMARGASAFLRKPVHGRTLLGAISAATACAEPGTRPHEISFQNFAPQFFGQGWSKNGSTNPKSRISPERSRARSPELPKTNVLDCHGNGPQDN